MRVAIVGGKLQGVEASFLAHEAGWEVILIDKKPSVPASGLCDSFYQCDIVKDVSTLRQIIENVDSVIPALEDVAALRSLKKCAADANVVLAYAEEAYFVTHSKKRSNRLFEKLGIPLPQTWPQCGLPIIVKPSTSSGSQGVSKLKTEMEIDDFIRRVGSRLDHWILQECLEGPSYSVEVLGVAGHFTVLQTTELEMDEHYDCKRVLAPAEIPEPLDRQFKEIALTIAKSLHLNGIMDVEVILHKGALKVLEIDARFPSQTPTTVYESTGINVLALLTDMFVKKEMPTVSKVERIRGVVYEHIKVSENSLEFWGEHIMGEADSLKVVHDFFGADVSLTNFNLSRFPWVATLIMIGESREQAWLKRCQVIENIKNYLEKATISK